MEAHPTLSVQCSSTSSEQQLSILDAEATDLWKQAELAFLLRAEDESNDDDAAEYAASNDPEIHVCPGSSCIHCEFTTDGYMCKVSGLAWPRFAKHDAISAGNVLSRDENGVPSSVQEDSRRRCQTRQYNVYRASQLAFCYADIGNSQKDDDAFIAYGTRQAELQSMRVLDLKTRRVHQFNHRRCRTSKRDITRVNLDSLVSEAMVMFDRLMKSDETRVAEDGESCRKRLTCTSKCPDGGDIRYYVEMCHASGKEVDLDRVHGMLRQHDTTVLMNDLRNIIRDEQSRHTHWYRSVREYASKLAVCLWKCVVTSPYMTKGRKISDNFRPFIAGVFFSTKRGVKLENGTVLIPRCMAVASALPRSRVTNQQSYTHQIHLSAHKGVSTLHKSIRSVNGPQRESFFSDAIELSRVLYEIDRIKSR